jgi:DNA-binding response OmpR family regulator
VFEQAQQTHTFNLFLIIAWFYYVNAIRKVIWMLARILIVEDEPKIVRFLELELSHEGYDVLCAGNGADGLSIALSEPVDLVLLDMMLPELTGMEVLRRLRRESGIPVIILTARDDLNDKVMGLDLGADDYITKPFRIEELLARIRAALRRPTITAQAGQLVLSDLVLDTACHTVTRGERALDLTKREFDLLEYLLRNRGAVLTRNQILEHVWGYDFEGDSNVVDVYIRYLRAKVEKDNEPKLIQTVRGVGYSIREKNP